MSLGLFLFGSVVTGIRLVSSLAIPGWASTMVLIGTIAAFNALVFAVFAEYLSIIFEELKQRPHFITAHVYRNGKPC